MICLTKHEPLRQTSTDYCRIMDLAANVVKHDRFLKVVDLIKPDDNLGILIMPDESFQVYQNPDPRNAEPNFVPISGTFDAGSRALSTAYVEMDAYQHRYEQYANENAEFVLQYREILQSQNPHWQPYALRLMGGAVNFAYVYVPTLVQFGKMVIQEVSCRYAKNIEIQLDDALLCIDADGSGITTVTIRYQTFEYVILETTRSEAGTMEVTRFYPIPNRQDERFVGKVRKTLGDLEQTCYVPGRVIWLPLQKIKDNSSSFFITQYDYREFAEYLPELTE